MNAKRTYLLAAYIILLGFLACAGWIYIGQDDDAPGAGMIGLASLLSSSIVGYGLVRVERSKR